MQIENDRFISLERLLLSCNERCSVLESYLRNHLEMRSLGIQTTDVNSIVSTTDFSSAGYIRIDVSTIKSLESRLGEMSSELSSARRQLTDYASFYDDRIISIQNETLKFLELQPILQSCIDICLSLQSDIRNPHQILSIGSETYTVDTTLATMDYFSSPNERLDVSFIKSLASRLEEISSVLVSALQNFSLQSSLYSDRLASMQFEILRFDNFERTLHSCTETCFSLEGALHNRPEFGTIGVQTNFDDIVISPIYSQSSTNVSSKVSSIHSLESHIKELSSILFNAQKQLSDQPLPASCSSFSLIEPMASLTNQQPLICPYLSESSPSSLPIMNLSPCFSTQNSFMDSSSAPRIKSLLDLSSSLFSRLNDIFSEIISLTQPHVQHDITSHPHTYLANLRSRFIDLNYLLQLCIYKYSGLVFELNPGPDAHAFVSQFFPPSFSINTSLMPPLGLPQHLPNASCLYQQFINLFLHLFSTKNIFNLQMSGFESFFLLVFKKIFHSNHDTFAFPPCISPSSSALFSPDNSFHVISSDSEAIFSFNDSITLVSSFPSDFPVFLETLPKFLNLELTKMTQCLSCLQHFLVNLENSSLEKRSRTEISQNCLPIASLESVSLFLESNDLRSQLTDAKDRIIGLSSIIDARD
ncbi:unnamed protein product, partial [Protopolystoma xenopodis]